MLALRCILAGRCWPHSVFSEYKTFVLHRESRASLLCCLEKKVQALPQQGRGSQHCLLSWPGPLSLHMHSPVKFQRHMHHWCMHATLDMLRHIMHSLYQRYSVVCQSINLFTTDTDCMCSGRPMWPYVCLHKGSDPLQV